MEKRKANQKRRDSKGRILRTGESQRKDGRYAFVYTDHLGKQKFIYSWKLEKTDPLPSGCRPCVALRIREQEILRDIQDGIIPSGGNLTVLELTEKYIAQKNGLKETSKACYRKVINIIAKDKFGGYRIDKVRISDAKEWFVRLQAEGKSYGTIQTIRTVIKPVFQMAVNDDLLRKNPFDFKLKELLIDDRKVRLALTELQEKQFLDFVQNSNCYKKYYEAIAILFKTGLRISELCGLTVRDIDFKERSINVDHQLQKIDCRYYIETTKSKSGLRKIPMSENVYILLKDVIEKQKDRKIEPVIDGYSGFLFLNRNGTPIVKENWERRFRNIIRRYNKCHQEKLPDVVPHVCRHTYCTNMARSGMNPKILQYLMGHSSITITLNYYTHLDLNDAKEELKRIENLA